MDRILGMLMDGLKAKNLHNCVNIIVASDHGEININSPQLGYSLHRMTETENYQFKLKYTLKEKKHCLMKASRWLNF